jgi:hypothetical protein
MVREREDCQAGDYRTCFFSLQLKEKMAMWIRDPVPLVGLVLVLVGW